MRKVEVTPYNSEWNVRFEEEASVLRRIFGPELVTVHHIGSTSVEGLQAKPIIDIMPVVKDIEAVDAFNDQMMAIGYEPRGENGIPGRRYFQKGGDNRTHHIHIFQEGDPGVERHLAVRDYLRAKPEARDAYGFLKEELAERYPHDMESYIKGKEQFVLDLEAKALEWYHSIK
ncbi:GrpB family protein [Pseudalkalibacillus sp. SCS-8]|uniref:GrpB family protein n=1 Tax=Pseudalkalibacillus nanhaiensis TaxID=3115291 RepID=UPI0032D9D612